MQRIGLLLFGVLFALLFGGYALAVGVDSDPALPPGALAIVEGAPGSLRVITKAEFDQEMSQRAAAQGLKRSPRPGDPEYDQLKKETMSQIVGVAWVEAQAEKMGLDPNAQEIDEKSSPAEEQGLKEIGLTKKEVDERMRWFLAGDNIQDLLRERMADPSEAEIRSYYEEDPPEGKSLAEARGQIKALLLNQKQVELFNRFESRWRAEWRVGTHCAEGFIVEECANYPFFDHPFTAPPACYEAEPKVPAEECPAPVIAPRPSRPGSVAWWRPEGERVAQGPVPEGGGEAEVPAE